VAGHQSWACSLPCWSGLLAWLLGFACDNHLDGWADDVAVAGLLRAAESWGSRLAVETPAGSLSYSELGALSRAGAQELGVARGDRVAIALPAGGDFAVALHACFVAGRWRCRWICGSRASAGRSGALRR